MDRVKLRNHAGVFPVDKKQSKEAEGGHSD